MCKKRNKSVCVFVLGGGTTFFIIRVKGDAPDLIKNVFSWLEWSCSENATASLKSSLIFNLMQALHKKSRALGKKDLLWSCSSLLIISNRKWQKTIIKKCWHPLKMWCGHKVVWLQNALSIKNRPFCFLPAITAVFHSFPAPLSIFLIKAKIIIPAFAGFLPQMTRRWSASALAFAAARWCICSCVTSATALYLFDYMA